MKIAGSLQEGLKLRSKDQETIKAMSALLPYMSRLSDQDREKVRDRFKDALNIFYKKNGIAMTIEAGEEDVVQSNATHDVEKFEKLFDGPLKPWLDKIDRPDEFKKLLYDFFDHISPSLQNSGALKNIFIAFANEYQARAKANNKTQVAGGGGQEV